MINNLSFILNLASALGCGLIAGVFFAFSVFIMKALAALPPASGIAAMQSINVVVLNPWFLGVLLGTAATSILLAVLAVVKWHQPAASYLLVAQLFYPLGRVLVTMLFNVPRKEALRTMSPPSLEPEISGS